MRAWLGLGKILSSPAFRGTVIFFTGVGLTIRESFGHGADRGNLYILWAGMMGFGTLQGIAQKKPPKDDDKPGDDE